LEQLKILKYFLIELITSEEKKEVLKRILNSIDVLIETCEETIEIVRNERNKNYNNYKRTRNPHNI
jgi:HEPN domain-containing protein